VRLRREGQPETSKLAVTGLFVFIGAKPGTGWLASQLAVFALSRFVRPAFPPRNT
jgi:hypothetical protein